MFARGGAKGHFPLSVLYMGFVLTVSLFPKFFCGTSVG